MKGIIILADNFEDIEALGTVDLIRRAHIDIDLVSITSSLTLKTQSGLTIIADKLLIDTSLNDYDFLIIPGGKAVMQTHLNSQITSDIVSFFMNKNLLVAAICAAPSVLGKEGYLNNKNFTCFPSFEKFVEKGIYDADQKVVVDGNIITARACGSTFEFAYEIIKKLKGENVAQHILDGVLY